MALRLVADSTEIVPQSLVLTVENTLSIRNVMRVALESEGYGVLGASNAGIALELL